ncbi:unnamed protein product, partial [Rotaria sp. Silwood2]
MIIFLLSYSIYILLLFQQNTINACPSVCLCHGPNIDCSNRGLHIIPSGIPKNVFKLNLQDNQIHTINIDAFRDLISLQK